MKSRATNPRGIHLTELATLLALFITYGNGLVRWTHLLGEDPENDIDR